MRITIDIPDQLHQELVRLASGRGITVASAVVELLLDEVTHLRERGSVDSSELDIRTVSFGNGVLRSDAIKAADEEW